MKPKRYLFLVTYVDADASLVVCAHSNDEARMIGQDASACKFCDVQAKYLGVADEVIPEGVVNGL